MTRIPELIDGSYRFFFMKITLKIEKKLNLKSYYEFVVRDAMSCLNLFEVPRGASKLSDGISRVEVTKDKNSSVWIKEKSFNKMFSACSLDKVHLSAVCIELID